MRVSIIPLNQALGLCLLVDDFILRTCVHIFAYRETKRCSTVTRIVIGFSHTNSCMQPLRALALARLVSKTRYVTRCLAEACVSRWYMGQNARPWLLCSYS